MCEQGRFKKDYLMNRREKTKDSAENELLINKLLMNF